MISITFSWHLMLMIIIQIIILYYGFKGHHKNRWGFDALGQALVEFLAITFSIAMWLIYGGIVWW